MPFGPLGERELAQIRKRLPLEIQALKDKYPQCVYNTSEAWGASPFPHGYIPESISIYYSDNPGGTDIAFQDGKLRNFDLEPSKDKDVIKVSIDDEWAYIQAGGKVLLDRLGEVILPDILLDQKVLLEFSLANLKDR
ncbi:MAG: hypothetical protein QNJ70_20155 [Xenococcaceae cyanobacterium MO_207.B15]|nr:hypothetical protein [Xenococcaceae cyanobacterium MO_207.B15]